MKLSRTFLKMVVSAAKATSPVEIGCDECWEKVDRFAELTLSGKSAADVLPLVQLHMEKCPECREEFEAMLKAMKAVRWNSAPGGTAADSVAR